MVINAAHVLIDESGSATAALYEALRQVKALAKSLAAAARAMSTDCPDEALARLSEIDARGIVREVRNVDTHLRDVSE
jgi:hypothetical protein